MSNLQDATAPIGLLVNLPLLSANFPPVPDSELIRDNIVSTLKNLLADNIYAVAIEGAEGIGKTTLLSQFVRRTSSSAISLFVSPANRLSYDAELIRIDLTMQVYWALTGEVLAPAQCDPTQLNTFYLNLQRLAKRRKEIIYFVIDGLEDLETSDRQTLLHQLSDILPIGVPQFRFLFSGDESLYQNLIGPRLSLKSFPLTEFGIEETRALFSSHSISVEVARDLNNICRGMPGRLAGVLRALERGLNLDDFIQSPPTEIFEVDWKQVDPKNETLQKILALLVHDLKPYTVEGVATILELHEEKVRQLIASVNFLTVDQGSKTIHFATTGLMKFAAIRLINLKATIQRIIIERLMAEPDSPEAVLELPERLENASEFLDLLNILTPEHILTILERTKTLSKVDDSVLRGYRGARKLGRDADLLRFGLQKSVISELFALNVWESEVAALTALDRDGEALALVNNAVLREDRLQMSSTLAHGIWLKGGTVQPELLEQIRLEIDNADFASLGRRARDIASKLVCVSPDLATTVLKKAQLEDDGGLLERDFLDVTMNAITGLKDERRLMEAIESVALQRKDPRMVTVLESIRLLLGSLGPTEVCKRAEEIHQTEAKLLVLQFWCATKGNIQDADVVAKRALELALGETSFQIDATFLADITQSLSGTPSHERKKELIAAIDGVRATGERLGPSVDYVRMSLSIAAAEFDIDPEKGAGRFVDVLDYIEKIDDLPSRGQAYARLLGSLNIVEPGVASPSLKDLRSQCSSALEGVVLQLEGTTADHHRSLAGVIAALGLGDLKKALDYVRVINTEERRDAAMADIVRSLVKEPTKTFHTQKLVEVLERIVGSGQRDEARQVIMEHVANDESISPEQIRDLLPIIADLHTIEESVLACKAMVRSIKVLKRAGNQYEGLIEHILSTIRKRWREIDSGWVRLDVGFGIARDLASTCRSDADAILTETESQKEECRITAHRAASAYLSCVHLTIRAFSGLLQKHLETESEINSLIALIDVIPSYGERAILWADVCMRSAVTGRSELAEKLASKYLLPAYENIPKGDVAHRKMVLAQIAPALYRTQPTVCLSELDTLDSDSRDSALRNIVRFLLFNRVPTDAVDTGKGAPLVTSYETLLKVVTLTSKMQTDWMIYVVSKDVADILQSPKNQYTVNTPQREDISRRIAAIAENSLPSSRQITHLGYRIITLGQAFRMRKTKQDEWMSIIQAAKTIGNISDRAFVIQKLAVCLSKNMTEIRDQMLKESFELIKEIPWDLDRIDRYIGFAEDVQDVDKARCRTLVKDIGDELKKTSNDALEQRRRLVDVAYQVDPGMAKGLIDLLDDDDARRNAQNQMKLLENKKTVTASVGDPDRVAGLGKMKGSEVSQLGWDLAKALSGNRVQTYHPRELRGYLGLVTEQPLRHSYWVLVWYLDNIIERFAHTEQAIAFVGPAFAACVVAAQLTGQIAGTSLVRLKAAKRRSKTVSDVSSFLASPGSRQDAIRILAAWCERNLSDAVKIHDPFFGPDDLHWIQEIRTVRPQCQICVMTSRKQQPTLNAGEELDEVYSASWKSMYDQQPPMTEIVVIGGEKTGKSPIHDRWLVSDGVGLRFGTSLNSLGESKESDISEMSSEDAEERSTAMEKYLNREVREVNGEKLRLMRFWLT